MNSREKLLKGTSFGFKRRLLWQMARDCDHWLEVGNDLTSLWAGDANEHIRVMKALWESLPDGEKPEHPNMEEIEEYAWRMCADEA